MNSKLEGILKWSLAQSDGTAPARQISEEERAWFKEAMEFHSVDVVKRMKEITMVMGIPEEKLLEQGVTVDELAGVLEELQEHVESIDMANDLTAIGGLQPLLGFLRSPHPQLRARAAEVVTTMVQNNERSQRSVMEAGGELMLCQLFLHDSGTTVRTKALGALSSLVRHNEEGLAVLRNVCGIRSLIEAATAHAADGRLARKALHLAKYLLEQCPSDRESALAAHGTLRQLAELMHSEHLDVRQPAAELLADLVPGVPDSPELTHLQQEVASRLAACGSGDEDADERAALQRLAAVIEQQRRGRSREPSAQGDMQPTLLLGPPPTS